MSTNVTIESIVVVKDLPEPDQRKPNTLYIPEDQGAEERDQCLGAFMDAWSHLERSLLSLLRVLLAVDYETTQVIFHSATSIKTTTDTLLGLMTLKLPAKINEWKALSQKCLDLSNSRNHLVHGYWDREIFVGVDERGFPVVERVNWLRIYMTGDPAKNSRAAFASGQPNTGQHRYDVERIQRKIAQVRALTTVISEFSRSLNRTETPP